MAMKLSGIGHKQKVNEPTIEKEEIPKSKERDEVMSDNEDR